MFDAKNDAPNIWVKIYKYYVCYEEWVVKIISSLYSRLFEIFAEKLILFLMRHGNCLDTYKVWVLV